MADPVSIPVEGGGKAWLDILQHSLGVDQYGRGEQYRSHFVTGEGSDDHPTCLALAEAGLMKVTKAPPHYGGMDFFHVTPAGRQWMTENSPAPPKLTRSQKRYQAWLDADSSGTFAEWIGARRDAHLLPEAGL